MSDPKMKTEHDEIAPEPSMLGEVQSHPGMAHDDVFGEMSEGGPNYRDVWSIPTVYTYYLYLTYLHHRSDGSELSLS